jgi:hypothetical protein
MKDWIAKYYTEMMSYDELRVVVGAFSANELGPWFQKVLGVGNQNLLGIRGVWLKCGRHLHPHLTYLVRRLILHLNAWTCMSFVIFLFTER